MSFAASITPLSSTLPEAIEEIGNVVNATAIGEIVSWYAENDAEVQAIIESLGSDNFRAAVHLIADQQEIVDFVLWVNSTGVEIIEVIHAYDDRFEWGLKNRTQPEARNSPKTWNDMINDIREVVNEEVLEELKELIEELVESNGEFDEYVRRTLALRPLLQALSQTDEFQAVGQDFRDLGVDIDAAVERVGEYLDWLESLYNDPTTTVDPEPEDK